MFSKKRIIKYLALTSFFVFVLGVCFSSISFAQAPAAQSVDLGLQFAQDTGLSTTDIRVTVANIIRIAMGLLGIIAIVLMMYGGFLWMTSNGDQSKVESAKKVLINATIGLVIILSAVAIATFVIKSLETATTGGSSGSSSTGSGGGGIGGGGAGGSSSFKVSSISPTGTLSIRNVQVKLYFNKNVDPASISSSSILVSEGQTGQTVNGTFNTNGSEVTFTPSDACPAPNTNLKCFKGNTQYKIIISTSGSIVRSDQNQQISCAFGGVCSAIFTTGSLVDTQKPTVAVIDPANGGSVSENSNVKLQAQADDDTGISSVSFQVDNSQNGVTPQFDAPQSTVKKYIAQSVWNTKGLALLSTHKIKATAKDIDSNSMDSSEIEVTIRAAHCFNKQQDKDEIGVDCGGKDCGACTGGQCTKNSDCQSGVCSNGKCVTWPVITGFNPDSSAQETFITITGSGFGKYVAGGGPKASQVNFLQAGNSTPGIIPQQCSAAWTDSQIIVEVPKALSNGAYDIEVVTVNNCDPDGLGKCNDTTQNNRGIKKQFTVDSNQTRPSLCNAKPAVGSFQATFDLEGKGLGTKPGDIFMGSFQTSHTGVWVQNKVGGVLVPNLVPGVVPTYIKIGTKQSNAVDFEIQASSQVPIITNLSPDNGNEGQYVQVNGSGFGFTQGKVWFIDPQSKNQVLGDIQSFPKECSGSIWQDNQIIVKVPTGLASGTQYDVQIETAVAKSNTFKFTRNNKSLTPGLCKIDPVQGPAQTLVKLVGENFGTAKGQVNFNTTQISSQQIASWTNQQIETRVPPISPGNVKVQVLHNNTSLSNKIDFVVGSCKANNNTCAVAGLTCCGDGTCQQSCPSVPKNSSFMYKFSTGVIPPVFPAPEVLEEQFCNAGKRQSPSPWRAWQDACPNADISTIFTLPMDSGTFKAGTGNDTIEIVECQDQQNCNGKPMSGLTLITVPGAKQTVAGFQISLPKNYKIGTDSVGLKPDTWYQVKLVGDTNGIKAANGVALEQDYIWQFKTRGAICPIAQVDIAPASATIDQKYTGKITPPNKVADGTQDLASSAVAQNCNILNAQGLTWTWNTAKSAYVDFEQVQPVLPANVRRVKGLQETGSQAVDVTATTQKQTGTAKIIVDFKDPKVVDYWPNCQEGCINAAIGAEIGTDLDPKTVNSTNVKVFLCDTGACLLSKLQPLGGTTITFKDNIINIKHPLLSPNEFYRVVFTNDIKSKSGVALTGLNYLFKPNATKNDSFSWTFRTKNDGTPCGVGRVDLKPVSAVVKTIGDKQGYFASPISAPDTCSPTGQLLDAYDYDWKWGVIDSNKTPSARATVYNQITMSLSSIQRGCTANCLNSGSTWYRSVCGNGIQEIGEDCDDGNTLNKDGCSAICVHEGTSPTCGNGNLDRLEDCDDGNTKDGDGCSAKCLNEGSSSTCGNGVNRRGKTEPAEDCDDGNRVDGDGCSSICLNEGSISKLDVSVCGDGIIDPGEDCDEGGVCDGGARDGQACGKTLQCPGDSTKTPPIAPGVCKPQKVVNGCSTSCTRVGNTAKTCGNGTVESNLGEQCDDKGPNDGCSPICLWEGSSSLTDSLCGNGKPEIGEVRACELSLPSDAKGSPYNWATAIGFIADKQGASTSSVKIAATITQPQSVTGQSDFILQCGYIADKECGNSSLRGRADNTCCYDRPQVVATTQVPIYPANDPAGNNAVCTNTLIQLPFNMPMSASSFSGNVILAEGVTQATCPTGQQKIDGLTGPGAITTWCTGGTTITSTTDTSGKILQVQLSDFLKDNTFYRIIVRGDTNLDDGSTVGITSDAGVGYNGPVRIKLDGKDTNTYTWVFKTATRCLLSQVTIENTANDPEPFSFREMNKAKNYKSIAQDQGGRLIQSVPSVYAWSWFWNVGPQDLFTGTVTTAQVKDSIAVEAINKNGKGLLAAEARIDETKLAGVARACSSNDQCNSGVCLAQNNKPCTGTACGDTRAPLGHCRVSIVGLAKLDAFICNNPWPTPGQGNTTSYIDTTYNFQINYCRDAGTDKVCRGIKNNGLSCNSDEDCNDGQQGQVKCVAQIDDDLPVAQIPIKRNIGGKICVGGTNANNPCTSNVQCTGGGTCKDTDLLAEYLFVLQREQKTCHDTGRNSNGFICKTDDDCVKNSQVQPPVQGGSGYIYCYADQNQKLSSINDGVGIRVMKNIKHLSPQMWYQEKIGGSARPSNLARVDGQSTCIGGSDVGKICGSDSECSGGQCVQNGYRAIQEGRTVYVNAVNAQNNVAQSFYTNIYLMSFNQNAQTETQKIFSQLLNSWEFNTNITNIESKKRAQRDTIRLEDLNYINDLIEKYKQANGTYPVLDSGTYVRGYSFTTWPSWNQAFASLLGSALPVDPVNKFKQCGPAFSEKTCWDSVSRTFDDASILKTNKQLDTGSYVYQYITPDNGKSYQLYYNIEFLGLNQSSTAGKANQCFDESANKWVNAGTYHSTRKLTVCSFNNWISTCGNGKIDAPAGEECDGSNVNFCEANVGTCNNSGLFKNTQCYSDADCGGVFGACQRNTLGIKWHTETVQVCNSSCQLTPSSQTLKQANQGAGYSCGGFCGDGYLNGNEKCDINNVAVNTSCSKEGWGDQGQVGCNLNSCGLYGGGCINGPLSPGDMRIRVEWARATPTTTSSVDLDIHLLVPYNKAIVASYGGTTTGDISKDEYAWVTKDDSTASTGVDIDNDGQPDGLELITARKVPGTGKYYNGVYSFVINSYGSDKCFVSNCKDIRVIVTQMDDQGKISQKVFTLPGATQGQAGSTLAQGKTWWHVFDMDTDGIITEIKQNNLLTSRPAHK